jgi:hypothetical protein
VQIPATQINAAGVGAMTQLYDNIASGAIASWDVQGISQAYNHLMLIVLARMDAVVSDQAGRLRFNGDTGANYDSERFVAFGATQSTGESLAATGASFGWFTGSSADANYASYEDLIIPHYTGTVFNKTFVGKNSSPQTTASGLTQAGIHSGLWRNTAAINRITVYPLTGNWIAGSRLTIYGLL